MVDPNSEDIKKLIAQAGSPSERAMLMVLHAIAIDLNRNTEATQEIAAEIKNTKNSLDQHIVEEMALFHGARGAWKATGIIGGVFFTALWAITSYVLSTHVDSLHKVQTDNAEQEKRITRIEAQHEIRQPVDPHIITK